MKGIIIYNTATGNTRAIARKLRKILIKYNHECDIYRDSDIKNRVRYNSHYFDSYDLLCLGSCTHAFQPAISFKTFIQIIKRYNLKDKSLVCFSSSGAPGVWEGTCNTIKSNFPTMNHRGNFGCSLRNYNSTIRNFEEFVKNLN
ncbi:MAG: flavodoxin family protein [Promethearchaeota archaeon]|jgi:flavodoxin